MAVRTTCYACVIEANVQPTVGIMATVAVQAGRQVVVALTAGIARLSVMTTGAQGYTCVVKARIVPAIDIMATFTSQVSQQMIITLAARLAAQAGVACGASINHPQVIEADYLPAGKADVTTRAIEIGHQMVKALAARLTRKPGMTAGIPAAAGDAVVTEEYDVIPGAGILVAVFTR